MRAKKPKKKRLKETDGTDRKNQPTKRLKIDL